MRLISRASRTVRLRPPRRAVSKRSSIRPDMARATERGCSPISLIRKCAWSPISAPTTSQSIVDGLLAVERSSIV